MIAFENVSKQFPDGTQAVRGLSLEARPGETLVLLGTSGCGKTTSLRMVNRLEEPTSGRILVNGKDVMEQNRIRLRREIGYAIQHIGLFPHMTVGENIAVVPRLLRWPEDRIRERVDRLIELMGLDPEEVRDRSPDQLSGGQKQRIGVARSLAADPPIVLMDEPFGALDPITREQLQNEFLELESEIEKTILFVTHDLFEAVKMGDRIALLDAGELQQLATPAELVESPANEFVDQFLGMHRFQLSLLTRTVRSLMCEAQPGEPVKKPPRPHLLGRSSFIEALDLFKSTRRDALPVFAGRRPLGELKKTTLTEAIGETLTEMGEGEASS